MSRLVFVSLLFVLLGQISCIETYEAQPTAPLLNHGRAAPFSINGDLAAFVDISSRTINMSRIESSGQVTGLSQFDYNEDQEIVFLNNEWVGISSRFIFLNPVFNLFKLDADNMYENVSATFPEQTSFYAAFMPDKSLVVVDPQSTVRTYVFTNDTWAVDNTANIAIEEFLPYKTVFSCEKYLIANNVTSQKILVYARQPDRTWTLEAEIPLARSIRAAISSNCNDTIILGDTKDNVLVFSKVDGTWSNSNNVTGTSIGLTSANLFGFTAVFIDQDTFITSAPFGTFPSNNTGLAYIVQRKNGVWAVTVQIGIKDSFRLGEEIYCGKDFVAITGTTSDGDKYNYYIVPTCGAAPLNTPCNGAAPVAGNTPSTSPVTGTTPAAGPSKKSSAVQLSIGAAALSAALLF